MTSIKTRLECIQRTTDEQRLTDRKFVMKSRRVARNSEDYYAERFGDRGEAIRGTARRRMADARPGMGG